MNKANRVIEGMSRELKLAHFSTGRVTVGTITQVFDNHLKKFYVAKIRGVIVGNEGEYKHETPEAARAYGKEIQARWRAEFTAARLQRAPVKGDTTEPPYWRCPNCEDSNHRSIRKCTNCGTAHP